MFKQLVFILSVSLVLMSCGKDDSAKPCVVSTTGVATDAEIAEIKAYLASKSLTATQDPSGFFYSIADPGSGSVANSSSVITVTYTGTLENGTVFDSYTTAGGTLFFLSQTIAGWQKGVPLIHKGGTITLYIPPSFGYGCTASGSIPAGATLIFTINLINIQ